MPLIVLCNYLAKDTMRQTLHNNSEKDDGKAGRESLTENKTN